MYLLPCFAGRFDVMLPGFVGRRREHTAKGDGEQTERQAQMSSSSSTITISSSQQCKQGTGKLLDARHHNGTGRWAVRPLNISTAKPTASSCPISNR